MRHKYLFAAFDFDGTLAPINNDPDAVFLSKDMKMRLEGLSRVCKVAIVTGRDLRDIRYRAGVPGLFYSGSHGFEISGPRGAVYLLRQEGTIWTPLRKRRVFWKPFLQLYQVLYCSERGSPFPFTTGW